MRVAQIRNELKASGTLLPAEPSDELLLNLGFAAVTEIPRPVADVVTEGAPIELEGVWTQQWESREFNEQELRERFEAERQRRLTELDERYDAQAEQGVPYEFEPGVIEHVQVRGEHKANLIGLCLDALIAIIATADIITDDEIPTTSYPLQFKTREDNFHALTAPEVIKMSRTVLDEYYKVLGQYWPAKFALQNAEFGTELPELPF